MCLLGSALSVTQYAKKVKLDEVAKGVQPKNTLLAWRIWKVGELFPSVVLRSQAQSSLWLPGEPMRGAIEDGKGVQAHGVHAYKSVKDMVSGNRDTPSRSDFKQEKTIVGQVLLWGKIAEHSNGYRAERGYPFLIYANGPELQHRISANYGCMSSRSFIPRLLAEAA